MIWTMVAKVLRRPELLSFMILSGLWRWQMLSEEVSAETEMMEIHLWIPARPRFQPCPKVAQSAFLALLLRCLQEPGLRCEPLWLL